ncbi:MAG: hypothetical protein WC512_00725 [Candidatus Omnitrophota bacterium]
MKNTNNAILRIILLVVMAYHLLLGAVTFLPAETAIKISRPLFGMVILDSGQLFYMSRLFGIYAAIFGLLMGICAIDPQKCRRLLIVGSGLFYIRAFNNIAMTGYFQTTFGMSMTRIWQCIITLLVFGTLILVFLPKNENK